MANNVIKRIWNQNKMVNIEALQGMAFQAEDGGHTFEISGVDDAGTAVPLSGTVAGVFMRPDRADIALAGSASGGVVSVTLTDDCYAVPGRFWLTIFVTSGGQKTAVYAAVGTVAVTSGGAVAGDAPQDVVDLINAIEEAVASIPASYTGLIADIAPTYSSSAVYSVGAYVYYNGDLYRCTTPITTAETWTAAHWTAAVLGDDVGELKIYIDTIYGQNIVNCCVDGYKSTSTYGGITYTLNADGSYTVYGTQSGTTFKNLTDQNSMPYGIEAGGTYFTNFNDPTGAVGFEVWCNGSTRVTSSSHPDFFTIPSNATTVWFRFATWNASNITTTIKVPVVSTLRSLTDDTITIPLDFYWEYNSNSTIGKAFTLSKNVRLLSGVYDVAKTITIPEGKTLKGVGISSTVINYTPTSGTAIICQNGNEQIKDMTINGGLTSKPSTYQPSDAKNGIVIQTETNKPAYVENVAVIGFSKNGILVSNRGYVSLCSIIGNNLFLQYNGCGICFTEKGEYGVLTNSVAIDNYFGIVDSGGNNKISNCGFDRNTKGLYAGYVNNDTHSDVVGCSFNHCSERAIELDGIASMLTFSACQMFGAGEYELFVYNSQATSFVNCEFGLNAKLRFNKANKTNHIYILNNCLFGNAPTIGVDTGTVLVTTNCYTQTGATVTA